MAVSVLCRVSWIVVVGRLLWGVYLLFFFFKQKTAYEMRISDWSSDVCSSDLGVSPHPRSAYEVTSSITPGELRNEADRPRRALREIGRASCRERVCQYV